MHTGYSVGAAYATARQAVASRKENQVITDIGINFNPTRGMNARIEVP
jgi:hypothetical protein